MLEWWNALDFTGQMLAMVAIPATVILIIQTIMSIIGAAGSGDMEPTVDASIDMESGEALELHADHYDSAHENSLDHDGSLRIFTIRGIVCFLCVFGWAGLLFLKLGLGAAPAILMALIPGVGCMFLLAWALKFIYKMQSSGNIVLERALGQSAVVYMNIPSNRSGVGKVNALVSGRYGEFEAITDDEKAILTGEQVKIIELTDENLLVVNREIKTPDLQ